MKAECHMSYETRVCRVGYGTTIHLTAGRHTQYIAKVLTKLMLVVEGFKTASHLHKHLCAQIPAD